jgi:hypothetical protein
LSSPNIALADLSQNGSLSKFAAFSALIATDQLNTINSSETLEAGMWAYQAGAVRMGFIACSPSRLWTKPLAGARRKAR